MNLKDKQELEFHQRLIKENAEMGTLSPYSDNIEYHKTRASEILGAEEYRKALKNKQGK